MSKSLGNALTLSASFSEIEEFVKKMYTDPDHIRVQDPGKVEGNAVFTYLDAFDSDLAQVAEFKAHYQRGGLGDMTIKRHLMQVLERFIAPIRERRAHLKKSPQDVFDALRAGTQHARQVARAKFLEVRESMRINYDF